MKGILKTATGTADLVLLQEPFLLSDYSFTVSLTSFDMQLSGGSSPTRRPRLAVFTSTSHPSLEVTLRHELTTDPDAQAHEIQAHGIPSLILYHVYNQQVNGDGVFTIERLFTRASVLPKRCILAGDFNAHHLWWNSNTTQERNAETLVPLLEDHHFDLLNEPDVCTHFPANGNNPSVLDLTFASPDVFDAISGWSQDKQAAPVDDTSANRGRQQNGHGKYGIYVLDGNGNQLVYYDTEDEDYAPDGEGADYDGDDMDEIEAYDSGLQDDMDTRDQQPRDRAYTGNTQLDDPARTMEGVELPPRNSYRADMAMHGSSSTSRSYLSDRPDSAGYVQQKFGIMSPVVTRDRVTWEG
ncbi:hypothetical protein BJ508DRAFT_336054 [Ascobolus immersus RN42]|uniref:Endonuclease/exonuclease/phosphatase domain-containing protein n=1 Tax=Ascobolus immersus RN42 TaxID=1160509 RepID=A0A3N4HH76_ASCIM|nr:hypothetical protein BJ508DRAFT_336054 [Ascobolus immersus RN42]